METKNKVGSNTIIGIIILLAGGLLLLRNFGFVPGEYVRFIFTWKTIIIVIGMALFFSANNKTVGTIFIFVGILGWLPDIWPALLIAVGVYIIFRNRKSDSTHNFEELNNYSSEPGKTINDTSIFGGSKKNIQIDGFKGGNVTAIFGGSELNFRDSTLAEGTHQLDVLFIFGGTNLMIPSDWSVSLETSTFLGSMKDKRIIQQSQVYDKNKHLRITGTALFGGGEIKNFVSF